MKVVLVIVATVAVIVAAEKHGNYRNVPSYKTSSAAYDQRQYESTTHATASYEVAETEASYQDESIYTKTNARSSYKPSYVATTTSYSKSSYEPSISSYVSQPKYYETTEPVRSYTSKPAYTGSSYSSPSYTTTTSAPYSTSQRYAAPSYSNKQDSYDDKPMPYAFSWGVKDEKSYNDYSHQQESNGKVVTGSYRVLLPDGRTQIVTYKADENGYVADVKYEGQVKHDEYKPTPKSTYKSSDDAYQAEAKRDKNYEPLDHTKASSGYNNAQSSGTNYVKSYDVPAVYTTSPYKPTEY
ncbi:adhesive plaque matrix protein-like [Daphnia carinata]|uniref:adhesive plaque matrix protein-like n=1 Tax=Daphnia carinata TaxID=120202 RepID=UPI00257A3FD7|nr:adhesive plaque matrix protein-like [Daphnia carinata]